MNLFQLPGTNKWVPVTDIALVERGIRGLEVVMTSTSNGYVHNLGDEPGAVTVEAINDAIFAAGMDELGDKLLVAAYPGLWVRRDLVACVSATSFQLSVAMKAEGGGRVRDFTPTSSTIGCCDTVELAEALVERLNSRS